MIKRSGIHHGLGGIVAAEHNKLNAILPNSIVKPPNVRPMKENSLFSIISNFGSANINIIEMISFWYCKYTNIINRYKVF